MSAVFSFALIIMALSAVLFFSGGYNKIKTVIDWLKRLLNPGGKKDNDKPPRYSDTNDIDDGTNPRSKFDVDEGETIPRGQTHPQQSYINIKIIRFSDGHVMKNEKMAISKPIIIGRGSKTESGKFKLELPNNDKQTGRIQCELAVRDSNLYLIEGHSSNATMRLENIHDNKGTYIKSYYKITSRSYFNIGDYVLIVEPSLRGAELIDEEYNPRKEEKTRIFSFRDQLS